MWNVASESALAPIEVIHSDHKEFLLKKFEEQRSKLSNPAHVSRLIEGASNTILSCTSTQLSQLTSQALPRCTQTTESDFTQRVMIGTPSDDDEFSDLAAAMEPCEENQSGNNQSSVSCLEDLMSASMNSSQSIRPFNFYPSSPESSFSQDRA